MIREPSSVCFYCADQNPHRDRSLGITNYTLGLLNGLKENGGIELRAVSSKSSPRLPDGIANTILPFATDNAAGRLLADHFHPLLAGKVVAEVWHYPKGFLPMGSQVRRPKVGTIADTILQFYADKYPQYRSRFAYDYWIAMLKNAVRKLDCIITVSEFSKLSILEFAERYHIKAPPIFVTYQGGGAELPPSNDKQLSRDYVLHLASTAPHKKTNWLLEQWSRLQQQRTSLPALRLIGQLDDAGQQLVRALKNVNVFPFVARAAIFDAMRGAMALILPSEIEGFGLPALEAYSCNTPVVYVKDTAVEEVVGSTTPGGFRFEDESFFGALTKALEIDNSSIANKRAELEQRFSWQRCVKRTIECYRVVAAGK